MRRFPTAFFAALAFGWALVAGAWAQEVEVTQVRFANVRDPRGANGSWLELDVQLNVRPPANAPGQMVSRVKVALLVGFDLPVPLGGERRQEYYRAEVECVALDSGRTDVRFYLPPEIVKRDQLHADPKQWGVELTAVGRALPPSRAAYATALLGAESRKNFQTRGGQAAAANDGILLPQYLTPFEHEYPRATPSFVRREAR